MTAKDFLLQAWQIDERIDRKIEERERLTAKLTAGRASNLTGMPRGGRFDWTDTVASVIAAEEAIQSEIKALCRVKQQVNAAIASVVDPRYRRVLELRYRNYMRWEAIADEMGYGVRQIYRLHGEALLRVQLPPTCH